MEMSAHAPLIPVEILIVEDSPTQAQRLRHILEGQGYQVTHAANGRLALEAAQRSRPALIISDVMMPEMDGYELCRCIKTDPQLADIPVILVTTLSDPSDVIRGLECRADNFILKPYDERYLIGRVQFVVVNREMQRTKQGAMGVEIFFNNQRHFITADRLQILNLLLSTYDAAIQRNKELTRAQETLKLVNARLATANSELEAFTHSVSHDLHAPLRHIAGYAELLESSADLPPEKHRRYLASIVGAARRMSQLIDDLMMLSRTARTEMRLSTVELETLVEESIQGLQNDIEGRNIIWKRSRLPCVAGDAGLLRQVFVNLISNAVKYSRLSDPAEIEIGCGETPEELIVHIRDNGVGFDMAYAHKLFGVFQRLHSDSEFEGTGVGLANVRRIVERHGGRVWAEGSVGEGAVFYFTIARQPGHTMKPPPDAST